LEIKKEEAGRSKKKTPFSIGLFPRQRGSTRKEWEKHRGSSGSKKNGPALGGMLSAKRSLRADRKREQKKILKEEDKRSRQKGVAGAWLMVVTVPPSTEEHILKGPHDRGEKLVMKSKEARALSSKKRVGDRRTEEQKIKVSTRAVFGDQIWR